MSIVHHHLIYQAKTGDINKSEKELESFIYGLMDEIDMTCLIPTRLAFSHQKAWTGVAGIVTSHIAFHYWTIEEYVQLDIYSCKPFDRNKAVNYINNFWDARKEKTLFIDREIGKNYAIESN